MGPEPESRDERSRSTLDATQNDIPETHRLICTHPQSAVRGQRRWGHPKSSTATCVAPQGIQVDPGTLWSHEDILRSTDCR